MKLVRFGTRGQEKPGIFTADGRMKDVSAHVRDYDHAFFAGGGLATLRGIAAKPESLPDVQTGVQIGAPLARPRNVFAIGLDARYLASKEAAKDHVAGFCVANDASERAFQLERGGQWSKGKSCDNFLPLGPWLVTADEVGNPQKLSLTLDVNGAQRQNGTTATMIFDIHLDLSYNPLDFNRDLRGTQEKIRRRHRRTVLQELRRLPPPRAALQRSPGNGSSMIPIRRLAAKVSPVAGPEGDDPSAGLREGRGASGEVFRLPGGGEMQFLPKGPPAHPVALRVNLALLESARSRRWVDLAAAPRTI
jgi:hypothetical protein